MIVSPCCWRVRLHFYSISYFRMAWRSLPPAIAQPMRLLQVYWAHNQMKSPREQYAEETPVPCLLPGHVSLLK